MDTQELVRAFEDATLPPERFDHRSHVTVAYTLLREHPFDEACERMRRAIRHYNSTHNIPSAIDRGYHETLTTAWLHIIRNVMDTYGPMNDAEEFFASHGYLLNKVLLRLFYSRRRIMSREAKERFVEPDLAPLPKPPGA